MSRTVTCHLASVFVVVMGAAFPGAAVVAAGDPSRTSTQKVAPLQAPALQTPSKGAAPSPTAAPALKPSPIYMTIQGIPGEAKNGKLQVHSFRQAGGQVGTAAGPGGGPHRPGQVVITKNVDKASPQLMQAAISGNKFNVLLFEFVQTAPGSAEHVYKTTKLTNAIVSSVRSIGSGDKPQEEVTFSTQKIE